MKSLFALSAQKFKSFTLTYLIDKIGKLIQTDNILRSVRPFSLDNELDVDMKEKVMQHLKPLINVIYSKGQYYIY